MCWVSSPSCSYQKTKDSHFSQLYRLSGPAAWQSWQTVKLKMSCGDRALVIVNTPSRTSTLMTEMTDIPCSYNVRRLGLIHMSLYLFTFDPALTHTQSPMCSATWWQKLKALCSLTSLCKILLSYCRVEILVPDIIVLIFCAIILKMSHRFSNNPHSFLCTL